MDPLDRLRRLLQDNGASVTAARKAVFKTLCAADTPLKTGEIASRTPTANRASVYRTLELFSTLGITTTIIRGWTPLTELAEPFRAHHHHITCSQCGYSESIADETLESILSHTATQHGFVLTHHTVELGGVCRSCQ